MQRFSGNTRGLSWWGVMCAGQGPGYNFQLSEFLSCFPPTHNGEVLTEIQQIHMCHHGVNLSGIEREWGPLPPDFGEGK